MDLGCHTLDLLDFLLGPLSEVQGQAANVTGIHPVEDRVEMNFMVGGAPGSATWNFSAERHEDEVLLIGTEGRLTFSCFGDEPMVLEVKGERETFELPNPEHVHQPLIQTLVDELSGKGLPDAAGPVLLEGLSEGASFQRCSPHRAGVDPCVQHGGVFLISLAAG